LVTPPATHAGHNGSRGLATVGNSAPQVGAAGHGQALAQSHRPVSAARALEGLAAVVGPPSRQPKADSPDQDAGTNRCEPHPRRVNKRAHDEAEREVANETFTDDSHPGGGTGHGEKANPRSAPLGRLAMSRMTLGCHRSARRGLNP